MNSMLVQPAKRLLLVYYTDPQCARSWAFEHHWRRLRDEFGHRFVWRYQLDGVGPGPGLRLTGAPASSALACLAVQCAEQQSPQAADWYLSALREAALLHRRDIARPEVLVAVAQELAARTNEPIAYLPGLAGQPAAAFDALAFHQAFAAQASAGLPSVHVPPARRTQPSLGLRQAGRPEQTLVITGQPYEALLHELAQAAPDLFYVASLVEGGAG
jgi:putative protein-disulfide isomerase